MRHRTAAWMNFKEVANSAITRTWMWLQMDIGVARSEPAAGPPGAPAVVLPDDNIDALLHQPLPVSADESAANARFLAAPITPSFVLAPSGAPSSAEQDDDEGPSVGGVRSFAVGSFRIPRSEDDYQNPLQDADCPQALQDMGYATAGAAHWVPVAPPTAPLPTDMVAFSASMIGATEEEQFNVSQAAAAALIQEQVYDDHGAWMADDMLESREEADAYLARHSDWRRHMQRLAAIYIEFLELVDVEPPRRNVDVT